LLIDFIFYSDILLTENLNFIIVEAKFMNNLLNNAIASIQVGFEDYFLIGEDRFLENLATVLPF
jgi:hypothetical protein